MSYRTLAYSHDYEFGIQEKRFTAIEEEVAALVVEGRQFVKPVRPSGEFASTTFTPPRVVSEPPL
ncbi:MAG: hypothetical protein U0894_07255 [Pirellulales bacterium]